MHLDRDDLRGLIRFAGIVSLGASLAFTWQAIGSRGGFRKDRAGPSAETSFSCLRDCDRAARSRSAGREFSGTPEGLAANLRMISGAIF